MANVRKILRPNGTRFYQVRWRTPDGKHRTKGGFPTKRAAEDYVNEVNYAQRRSTTFDPKSGAVTFREAAQDWLSSRHDLKRSTHAGYEHALTPKYSAGNTNTNTNSTSTSTGSTEVKNARRDAVNAAGRAKRAALSIDATFGSYPINKITRTQISEWVSAMATAGSKPSTVRHAFFIVRMVLAQAVVDGRLATNPADYVKLPTERSTGAAPAGVVDDPAQFLTAAQVAALVAATPWPYNVTVHLAAWAGLRAAELCGLQVGDVDLPTPTINPNAPAKPGMLRVERTVLQIDGVLTYDSPKTRGSRRTVPLPPELTAVLRDYLAVHPRRNEPTAPLFPGFGLTPSKPAGIASTDNAGRRVVPTPEEVRGALSVQEACDQLTLDWSAVLRHGTFYRYVYRPAVLRAIRLGIALGTHLHASTDPIADATTRAGAGLPPALRFHALRHTYASLCVAAGILPLAIAKYLGHSKVTTTMTVYAHLFEDDHSDAMAALGAMSTPSQAAGNVVPIRRMG